MHRIVNRFMKANKMGLLIILVIAITSTADQQSPISSREHILTVHQDISKWDKNGDGRLTGAERDAFIADKRKEMAEAATARAAKVKPKPAKPRLPIPTLSPEDARK